MMKRVVYFSFKLFSLLVTQRRTTALISIATAAFDAAGSTNTVIEANLRAAIRLLADIT